MALLLHPVSRLSRNYRLDATQNYQFDRLLDTLHGIKAGMGDEHAERFDAFAQNLLAASLAAIAGNRQHGADQVFEVMDDLIEWKLLDKEQSSRLLGALRAILADQVYDSMAEDCCWERED